MEPMIAHLPDYLIANQVSNALSEDLQGSVDFTAELIDSSKQKKAYITTNQDMLLCGTQWANYAFNLVDSYVEIKWYYKEGEKVKANQKLCEISGNARSMLTAERTALNFLQTLSATATVTRAYVDKVKGTMTQIMDTRKTIPGLRLAQKYAVTVGGGVNQRIGLFDGVLIKENHIIAHGSISKVLSRAFDITPVHIPIQIEIETFDQLKEAVTSGAKLILLDNMDLDMIKKCVEYCIDKPVELEVSGNVNLSNVLDYAKTGVHRISIGAITKNISAIDLSMRFI